MCRKRKKKKRSGSKKKLRKRFSGDNIPVRYREWRNRVLRRDGGKCQMPGCNCNARSILQVHHIVRWADDRSLRYNTDNGITLCRRAHKKIFGKEYEFEALFKMIVQLNKNSGTNTRSRT